MFSADATSSAPRQAAATISVILLIALSAWVPGTVTGDETPPAGAEERLPAGVHVAGRDGVTVPQALEAPLPKYPLPALREENEGQVELLVRILPDGSIASVDVLSCTNPGHGFEDAAREAVAARRYAPAFRDGEAVEAVSYVTVGFEPESHRVDRLWDDRKAGLRKYAEGNLYAEAPHLAGEGGVTSPVVRKRRSHIHHNYPQAARMREVESRVYLLLEIGEDGTVARAVVSLPEVPGFDFEKAGEDAVKRWLFEPARLDGTPVKAWHWLEVDFSFTGSRW